MSDEQKTESPEREGCNCISQMDKALEEHGYNTVVGSGLYYHGNIWRVKVEIATYVKEKKRGAKAMAVVANYCPFCGKQYPKDKPEIER